MGNGFNGGFALLGRCYSFLLIIVGVKPFANRLQKLIMGKSPILLLWSRIG